MFLLLIGLVISLYSGKKAKLPSKIGDGFVLEFTSPYNSITIDTDQKNLPNREFSDIVVITPQTVFQNNKGTSITPETIRPGMAVEVKLDTTNFMQLTALQIKLRTNADDWRVHVDGHTRFCVENAFAFVDAAKIVLPPEHRTGRHGRIWSSVSLQEDSDRFTARFERGSTSKRYNSNKTGNCEAKYFHSARK